MPCRGSRRYRKSPTKCPQIFSGIAGSAAAAHFEMELRNLDAAGRADGSDLLALADPLPALDQYRVVVGVGGDPAARVLDQEKVAEAPKFVSGIGDDAVLRRLHRRAPLGGDVDAVVAQSLGLSAEAGNHPAFHRPDETPAAGRRRLGHVRQRELPARPGQGTLGRFRRPSFAPTHPRFSHRPDGWPS